MTELRIWASAHALPGLCTIHFYTPIFDLCRPCSVAQNSCWCLSLYFMLRNQSLPRLLSHSSKADQQTSADPGQLCMCELSPQSCNRAMPELLMTRAQMMPAERLNSAVHAGAVLVHNCMEAQSS